MECSITANSKIDEINCIYSQKHPRLKQVSFSLYFIKIVYLYLGCFIHGFNFWSARSNTGFFYWCIKKPDLDKSGPKSKT